MKAMSHYRLVNRPFLWRVLGLVLWIRLVLLRVSDHDAVRASNAAHLWDEHFAWLTVSRWKMGHTRRGW